MIYNSFVLWVEAQALPLQRSNPTWHRLDGLAGSGNREVVGRFKHEGQIWKVHGDTRFNPVLRAYDAVHKRQVSDPFLTKQTKGGLCLVLKPELWDTQLPTHFYVYEQAQ